MDGVSERRNFKGKRIRREEEEKQQGKRWETANDKVADGVDQGRISRQQLRRGAAKVIRNYSKKES